MKRIRVFIYVTCLAGLSACATTGNHSPLERLATNDVVAGTGYGLALGCIAGGIIDSMQGKDVGDRGTQIGCAAGAAVGFVAGKVAAERRKKFASDAAFLDAEIAAAETAVNSKQTQLASLDQQLASTRQRIDSLETRMYQNQNVMAELQQVNQQLTQQISSNNQTAENYKNSLSYLDQVIVDTRSTQLSVNEQQADRDQRIASLNQRKQDLTTQYAQLNGVNQALQSEQQRVTAMLQRFGQPRT